MDKGRCARVKNVWNLTAWGVRGSMPMAWADYLEYGGNTSCFSVDYGEGIVVFDGGTGLIRLGEQLKSGGLKRVDIFFSHVHLDHIVGLTGFSALHDPKMDIHLYGEARNGTSFRQQLELVIGPPYWPLGLEDFRAGIEVHEVEPDDRIFLGKNGDVTVSVMRGNHPNQGLLYRMASPEHSVVYALDCEMDQATRRELVRFAQGVDVLIWDASYTREDLAQRQGWGHSSWEEGAAVARETGAGLALMAHYASEYTDRFLREQERNMGGAVRFAREGMEIEL